MRGVIAFCRATVLGGIVFLVPLVAILYVVGKALAVSKQLAAPVVGYLPVGTIVGIAVVDLAGIVLIVAVCFVAGLLARNSLATAVVRQAETRFLSKLPGYGMLKGLSESFSEQGSTTMKPVLVQFDDVAQIGLEVERLADGRVVVYVPGAPGVWSGSVVLMAADRVTALPTTAVAAVQSLRTLGQGTGALVEPAA